MGWWMYWSKDVEERVKTSKVVCGCSVKKDMSVAVFLFFLLYLLHSELQNPESYLMIYPSHCISNP